MRLNTKIIQILLAMATTLSAAASDADTTSAPVITPDGFVTPGGAIGTPPRPDRQSVGLVLSGGGAKGIAHIGVIQAFEDNGIPIDYITGTSMGAVVGGLYAAGYSPKEMIDVIASKSFASWSTGKINPEYTYYFNSHHDTPSFVTLNLGKDSTQITSVLPVSLINPIPMNYAFLEIYGAATVECGADFNRLFVPLRTVTSNVYAKHKVVLGRGSLGDAVRMSMSFPMIFEPILLDGVPMYDGGIYDNYPVDVMVDEFNPDVIIGVNVGSGKTKPDTRNMMDQLEEMIMQPNDYPFPTAKGVNIRIDLDEFGLLAFDQYKAIYDIGYKHALAAIDSIRQKVHVRVEQADVEAERAKFKARSPEVKINRVNVSGGTREQDAFLHSFFEHRNGPMTLIEGRDAYYRAISTGRLQNFIPTPMYNERDSMIDLDFQAVVRDPYTIGIGGYISSSTNSMLFFNTGYNTLSFKSIKANINAWLGQSYMAAQGDFSYKFDTHNPTALIFNVVTFRQKYHETEKLFYQIHEPDFIRKSETFVRALYSTAPDLRSVLNFGIGYGHLTDKYHADLFDTKLTENHDKGIFNLGQIYAMWERSSLDNQYTPTSGYQLSAKVMGVAGRYHYYPSGEGRTTVKKNVSWAQADLKVTNFFELHRKFSLGLSGQALLSTRKLLPTYDASIVAAEAFHPTPSSYNYFNSKLHANSFVTAGVMPVWKISGSFQLRGSMHCFLPVRKICVSSDDLAAGREVGAKYGKWFHDPEFFGELQAVLALPFGSISAYGNYTSSHDSNWNFGISIGAFILAPKFLK